MAPRAESVTKDPSSAGLQSLFCRGEGAPVLGINNRVWVGRSCRGGLCEGRPGLPCAATTGASHFQKVLQGTPGLSRLSQSGALRAAPSQ